MDFDKFQQAGQKIALIPGVSNSSGTQFIFKYIVIDSIFVDNFFFFLNFFIII